MSSNFKLYVPGGLDVASSRNFDPFRIAGISAREIVCNIENDEL